MWEPLINLEMFEGILTVRSTLVIQNNQTTDNRLFHFVLLCNQGYPSPQAGFGYKARVPFNVVSQVSVNLYINGKLMKISI